MKKVWIRHPNLDDRDPIEVAESSLPFHINAGWEQVPEGDEPPQPGEPTPDQKAEESQEESEERKTTRTSRSRTKAEDKKEAEG